MVRLGYCKTTSCFDCFVFNMTMLVYLNTVLQGDVRAQLM